jgi:hypothetical protein
MARNMSTLDRVLRAFVIAPAFIIVAAVIGISSVGGIVLLAVAAVMLATAAAGRCPLYALFHLDTRGRTPLPH